MFKKFNSWLTEDISLKKLSHLEHPEDFPSKFGREGARHAILSLHQVHRSLKGQKTPKSTRISRKEDGSPAVVFGHHPQSGKFFVATKSAFNKNPKINYSNADIEKNHGHAPGLVSKLKASLKHLPSITKGKGVYQGDLLYTKGDVKSRKGNLSFTPNTLTYNVNKHSPEGHRVSKSNLGIVVHTKYHGSSIENMTPHSGDYNHEFNHSHKVNTVSPTIHNVHSQSYHPTEQAAVHKHLKVAVQTYKKMKPEHWAAAKSHSEHLSAFYNNNVRAGTHNTHENYRNYLANKANSESAQFKTPERKMAVASKYNNLLKTSEHVKPLLVLHHHIGKAKDVMVNRLNQSAPTHYAYTLGKKKSHPEGYVVSRGQSKMTKLVNRGEFSKANFEKNR